MSAIATCGDEAVQTSTTKVRSSEELYLEQFGKLAALVNEFSDFYKTAGDTLTEARKRAHFLKDVIENKGGHKLFYLKDEPIHRETDLHILYRLTWYATSLDVSREVNDGRGPADYKVSTGATDKTLIEFKLASNSSLEKNLAHQIEIYQKASDAGNAIKMIIYFSKAERERVTAILRRLKLDKSEDIVLIDARLDNKPSGSKAAKG